MDKKVVAPATAVALALLACGQTATPEPYQPPPTKAPQARSSDVEESRQILRDYNFDHYVTDPYGVDDCQNQFCIVYNQGNAAAFVQTQLFIEKDLLQGFTASAYGDSSDYQLEMLANANYELIVGPLGGSPDVVHCAMSVDLGETAECGHILVEAVPNEDGFTVVFYNTRR